MSPTPEQRLAVVIEDDPDVRTLLCTVLGQSGFTTIPVSNGEDGIRAVQQHNPLITTLDVIMPGMDGFAVARRLRQFTDGYIVMVSGQEDEIDMLEGLGAGADDYLLKPFRPRELRARVETMLRRPRGNAPAAGTGESFTILQPAAAAPVQQAAPQQVAPQPVQPVQQVAPQIVQQPVQQVAPQQVVQQPAAHFAPHQPQQPTSPQGFVAPQQPVQAQPVQAPIHHQAVHAQASPVQRVETLAAAAPQQQSAPTAVLAPADRLQMRGLVVDTATRMASVDGRGIELTRSEFDLLASLMNTGRRVRSKADLVLALRGETYATTYYVTDADKRAVEVHTANLRRKLGDSSSTPRFIETVRGVGYRMTEQAA